jgi:hypothetical protein
VKRIYGDAYRHHEKRSAAKNWVDDLRNGFHITMFLKGGRDQTSRMRSAFPAAV